MYGDETHEYLHADGVWRTSTYSNPPYFNDPTGYFASEVEAKAALAKERGETVT